MNSSVEEKLYTVPEVARILRVGANTVYREIQKGNLNATRVGRLIRVREVEVAKYIERYLEKRLDSKAQSEK